MNIRCGMIAYRQFNLARVSTGRAPEGAGPALAWWAYGSPCRAASQQMRGAAPCQKRTTRRV
eukprot:7347117-Alexandrium_andersonii.AAC.1